MGVIAARVGGATGIATFTIAIGGLVTLVFLLAQGLATAGIVLVSDSIGRGSRSEAERAGWCAIALTIVAMAACGIGCSFFAEDVARAFTSDAVIAASLVSVMGQVTLLLVPDGGQGAADSVLRARGVNWFPTIARFVAFVLIAPSFALWLGVVKGGGLAGVVTALLMASTGAFLALLLRLALLRALLPHREYSG